MIQSTMSEAPLTLNAILRHGRRAHAGSNASPSRPRRTPCHVRRGGRQRRSAGGGAAAPRGGTRDVVGTFMWNDQEHLEAYFAVPCSGLVLHTLNIRLSANS